MTMTAMDAEATFREDPAKARRFRAFLNADDPDPSVVFVPERLQIRPARPDDKAVRV